MIDQEEEVLDQKVKNVRQDQKVKWNQEEEVVEVEDQKLMETLENNQEKWKEENISQDIMMITLSM